MRKPLSPSSALAKYTYELRFDDVPTEVVDYAKTLSLDLLGVAIAGVQTEEARATLRACQSYGTAGGNSVLIGTGLTAPPGLSALHNGILAHALELDDFNGADHSGAVVIPALIALAGQDRSISGKRLLESIVVGYDIAKRLMDGCGGYAAANAGGWHSTGPCGSLGAAAAAAKMIGLDETEIINALGLAGSFTGGTWAFLADGSMSKRYHAGRAAETGVMVAYLAQAGFTGPAHVLDAEWGGFFKLYAPTSTDLKTVTEGLDNDYRIMKAGIKPYASCRGIHSAIDVILDLRESEGLRPDDVESLEVFCTKRQRNQLGNATPETRLAAQMSMPHSLAVALIEGSATLDLYRKPWLGNPDVLALAQKVHFLSNVENGEETTVRVLTTAGKEYRRLAPVSRGKGGPENRMSSAEIDQKFDSLVGTVYSDGYAQELRDIVQTIDTSKDISALLAVLQRDPSANDPCENGKLPSMASRS